MSQSAVEITDLVKRYGRGPDAVTAINGLSFAAAHGEVTAVLGPNGAGKTSTIEICEGYRARDGGSVRVLGLEPSNPELKTRVGVMLQAGGVYPSAYVREMLRHVAGFYAEPLNPDDLLERLGLSNCGRTPYRRLSGGQQQRLALAMAIVGQPDLVFLDEPTAGLDPQARLATWDLVRELRDRGTAVIVTTHLMDEAERLADHIVIIDHGRLIAEGPPAVLTRQSGQLIRIELPAGHAADIGALGRALPPGWELTTDGGSGLRLSGTSDLPSPQGLLAVAEWLAASSLVPVSLTVGHSTLEDVFLELTGRALR